jgi:hypothetical protein
MFVLYPDGKASDSSSSNESQLKTNLKFFGKLGLYFIAIRVAHVFLTASSGEKENQGTKL